MRLCLCRLSLTPVRTLHSRKGSNSEAVELGGLPELGRGAELHSCGPPPSPHPLPLNFRLPPGFGLPHEPGFLVRRDAVSDLWGHAFTILVTNTKSRESLISGLSHILAHCLLGVKSLLFASLLLFRAAPAAYGGSQATGRIGTTAAGLHHSHSNAGSLTH